jgi:hypothetical protein
MALFGAPIAHADHAQRACYAALHLSDVLRRYADEVRRAQGLEVPELLVDDVRAFFRAFR